MYIADSCISCHSLRVRGLESTSIWKVLSRCNKDFKCTKLYVCTVLICLFSVFTQVHNCVLDRWKSLESTVDSIFLRKEYCIFTFIAIFEGQKCAFTYLFLSLIESKYYLYLKLTQWQKQRYYYKFKLFHRKSKCKST